MRAALPPEISDAPWVGATGPRACAQNAETRRRVTITTSGGRFIDPGGFQAYKLALGLDRPPCDGVFLRLAATSGVVRQVLPSSGGVAGSDCSVDGANLQGSHLGAH